MQIHIEGVPLRHCGTLRQAVCDAARAALRHSCGESISPHVEFGGHIHASPLILRFGGALEPRLRLRVADAIAGACYEHSKQTDWWYQGFSLSAIVD